MKLNKEKSGPADVVNAFSQRKMATQPFNLNEQMQGVPNNAIFTCLKHHDSKYLRSIKHNKHHSHRKSHRYSAISTQVTENIYSIQITESGHLQSKALSNIY